MHHFPSDVLGIASTHVHWTSFRRLKLMELSKKKILKRSIILPLWEDAVQMAHADYRQDLKVRKRKHRLFERGFLRVPPILLWKIQYLKSLAESSALKMMSKWYQNDLKMSKWLQNDIKMTSIWLKSLLNFDKMMSLLCHFDVIMTFLLHFDIILTSFSEQMIRPNFSKIGIVLN